MASLNKVLLIGRLGQDPEKKSTPSGKTVVKLSLATNEHYTDRSGEKREKTEWHRLVFWEKLANIVAEYCNKGSLIFIEGSLRNNEWQDKDGNKKSITEITVLSLQFLDSNKKSTDSTSSFKTNTPTASDDKSDQFLEDDIPF